MAINVPQSVFDKYFEVIDSTFTIFGITCQLVFIETVEEISTSFDNFTTHNSVNAHRRGGGNPGFEREDKVFKEVEKTEDAALHAKYIENMKKHDTLDKVKFRKVFLSSYNEELIASLSYFDFSLKN